MKRTDLDARYEKLLKEFRRKLFKFNQEAVKRKEDNVKFSSCHFIEIIETYLEYHRLSK